MGKQIQQLAFCATCAKCIESDTRLANRLKAGERYSIYQCSNGLTDAASPITISFCSTPA